MLFSGLDFDKSETIYTKNKSQRKGNKPLRNQPANLIPDSKTGILYQDELKWFKNSGWVSGFAMFFLGSVVSLFTGMDYLTNSGKISFILSGVKWIGLLVVIIFFATRTHAVQTEMVKEN